MDKQLKSDNQTTPTKCNADVADASSEKCYNQTVSNSVTPCVKIAQNAVASLSTSIHDTTPIKKEQTDSKVQYKMPFTVDSNPIDKEYCEPVTSSFSAKPILREVTKAIQGNTNQIKKISDVMENMYETVRAKDAKIALKEGLLLPIAHDTGEKHYVITKFTNKVTTIDKNSRMDLLIESLFRYCCVYDSPLYGFAAKEIFDSDVVMLYLKEVEDDEEEPYYTQFGTDKNLKLAKDPEEEDGEDKFNCACSACIGQDACDEYLFGSYCIATVKRYFSENKYHSTVKGAYKVFVANYNRVLDYHSFDDNRESAGMRHTEVTRPPLCMKNGSLKYALFWIKWQVENGPLKEYYTEARRKRKLVKMTKDAKIEAKSKYRYVEPQE